MDLKLDTDKMIGCTMNNYKVRIDFSKNVLLDLIDQAFQGLLATIVGGDL